MERTVETMDLKSQSLRKQFRRWGKGSEILRRGGSDSEAMSCSSDSSSVILRSELRALSKFQFEL